MIPFVQSGYMHECLFVDCVWHISMCDNKQLPIKATHDRELINYFEWSVWKERERVGISIVELARAHTH